MALRWREKTSYLPATSWRCHLSWVTRLFERLAIDVMLECSISGACGLLRISWDEADGIKQRAVKRGLARKTPRFLLILRSDRFTDSIALVTEARFVELQRRRSQPEGRIAIFKNGFGGRPLRAKGFKHREMAVTWQVLTHNLWVLARLEQKQALALAA